MDADAVALPSTLADVAFAFGAMDSTGHQWADAMYDPNNVGVVASTRAQRTDACLEETNASAAETLRAHAVSMDSTGFTVHFDVNTVGPRHVYSLALHG